MLLQGRDIGALPPHARPVGMVFQSYALFPHLSVFDNVAYGLRRDGVARPEIARRVAEALASSGWRGWSGARRQLSGGQRQRVALVRSLVKRPPLLLLDEPLGALDAGLRERTGLELRALQRATGAGFVMVTHDQAEALALADRVAVLEAGRLAQYGPPQVLYDRPATRIVATFLGAANILEGRPRPDGAVECAAGCVLAAAGGRPPAGAMRCGRSASGWWRRPRPRTARRRGCATWPIAARLAGGGGAAGRGGMAGGAAGGAAPPAPGAAVALAWRPRACAAGR